ncbi:membrane protein [Acidobacteria bacterium Mor1]|nr:membrane protein [Acidobacteria bacterium Mor1]
MSEHINIGAVLAAAAANFLIGGLWYSPALFGKAWMRANGFSEADLQKGSPAVIFGVSALFCLIMAANLAAFLAAPETTFAFAVAAGVAAGLGWAAMGLGVVALFERRPCSYLLVNGGYLTVSFAAMGAILGAWR